MRASGRPASRSPATLPAGVAVVFLTPLHAGLIGWAGPGAALLFPSAVVMCGAAERQTPPMAPAPGEVEGRTGLAAAQAAGALRPIGAAAVELAPGVSAHHGPGQPPGHDVVRVSSNEEAACLLADVVHPPLQLNDQGISFLSEAGPERAPRVREELLTALPGAQRAHRTWHSATVTRELLERTGRML